MVPALLQFQAPAHLFDLAQAAIVFVVALASCLVLRHVLIRGISKAAQERDTPAFELLQALRGPSILWCLAGSLVITLELTDVPGAAGKWARGGSFVFLVISICVVTSNLILRLTAAAGARRGLSFVLSGVSKALIQVFVMVLGVSILLRYFNIAVTPILTALGVGGLAVALALRDTLANFFAGIHILVESPISVGDFVHLSSGEEGTIADIGWRTTRLLTGSNNTIVIPNEKITSSILTNCALPDPSMMTDVQILTGHRADFNQVRSILIEEAAQAEHVDPGFQPLVFFDPGVTPSYLGFKVIVKVPHRLKAGGVQSEIRTRVFERFRREGIPLPEPGRVL